MMIGLPRVMTAMLTVGVLVPASAGAHAGPPYPIVTDRVAGAYSISIWTDPDATDDRTAGGQFWVQVTRADKVGEAPSGTRATVSVQPLDRSGAKSAAGTVPVRGDVSNQFAALVFDHEGRFAVHVAISGPLGVASISSEVNATYDLRPSPYMMIWYLAPFVIAGLLWTRLLIRRFKRASGMSL